MVVGEGSLSDAIGEEFLDITPDPRVLIALTRTPLAPIDALCELIDNGIDSFHDARLKGHPVVHPLVQVTLPGAAEVGRGEGVVRVQDNGLGQTASHVANALRAGYTSKNPFDTLGLFGMGFNIATGKLGRRTRLLTCRQEDDFGLEVTLDLVELTRTGEFKVPVHQVQKPVGFEHGTVVEVFSWWPDGDPNSGFVRKLAGMSRDFVRQQIGRRYSSILRASQSPVRIVINEKPSQVFEHCVWSPERFVERHGWGRIPATTPIEEVIFTSRRCNVDGTIVPLDTESCPECSRSDFKIVDERVHGWVGIQRFDAASEFGIDLIRNGRAIRVGEKQAFFTYVDEDTKKEEKEYPIDQIYGRIVGEIHLDHVPVDFQKQDFQRSSDEWRRVNEFLRGGSLIPSRWPQGQRNMTPVSRLFQGYRKVRNFGRADMYMGRYSTATGKAERIDRAVEREYYEKFLAREPGYYDDEKWWELVETANIPPIAQLPECPACGFQNLESAEVCEECGHVLKSKLCIACGEIIAQSAISCEHCGVSQVPEVREPWHCNVCGETNDTGAEICVRCSSVRGTPDPASQPALEAISKPSEALSLDPLSLRLADGSTTSAITVEARIADQPLRPAWESEPLPSMAFREAGIITMFIDPAHSMFQELGVRPESVVAYEVAQYLYDLHGNLIGRKEHSLSALASQVLKARWADELSETPEDVRASIVALFATIAEALVGNPRAGDFYGELEEGEQTALAQGMIAAGVDIAEAERLKNSGAYLRYVSPATVVNFFRRYPDSWFGGQVWTDALPTSEIGEIVAKGMREELVTKYLRCLEDCASYLRYQHPERLIIIRASAALDFLEAALA
jgi:Double zinc ribbon/Histidine kinase-, DNA gyrase B-, and HSP90-like ATPase